MKIQYYIISMFCLLLIGCNPKWDFDSELFEPQIVVEGWIENGQFPLVCLTQTKSLNNSIGENDLNDLAIRWAKVSVSDGTKDVYKRQAKTQFILTTHFFFPDINAT